MFEFLLIYKIANYKMAKKNIGIKIAAVVTILFFLAATVLPFVI